MDVTIVRFSCAFLSFLLLSAAVATVAASALHIFTPLAQIGVSVPRSPESLALLRNIPLTKIGVRAMSNIRLDGDYYFEFEKNNDAVAVDGATGAVFIGNKFHLVEDTTTYILNIKDQYRKGVVARVSVTATPIDVESVEEFCDQFTSKLCFWDNILFHVTENNLFLQEVGKLAPSAYTTLCPHAIVEYKVLDGEFWLVSRILYPFLYFSSSLSRTLSFPYLPLVILLSFSQKMLKKM